MAFCQCLNARGQSGSLLAALQETESLHSVTLRLGGSEECGVCPEFCRSPAGRHAKARARCLAGDGPGALRVLVPDSEPFPPAPEQPAPGATPAALFPAPISACPG